MTSHFLTIAKRIAAMALLFSFFLPLSQCSLKVTDQDPAVAAQAVADEPADIAAYSAYPWPSIASAVVLLLFAWPTAVQCGAWLKPGTFALHAYKLALFELPLAAVTLCCIVLLASMGQHVRYGAFAASAAVACYALAVLLPLMRSREPRSIPA
ncbi:hypothetical protein ACO0LO_05630 [Undibacterium sp. TJN25]|uniref:hypothetical protein n=1 Tax=Undibacterium sp. TJN25 TaxID=3413056 RepID=UPI003BF127E8